MVIGIDLDLFQYSPDRNGIFGIIATGTALRLKKNESEPTVEGGNRTRKTRRRKHL
jgi:hypothetical protein